jgi:hypothetical protein
MSLQYDAVSKELKKVLIELMGLEELKQFRLVGGTALALLYGHRKSIDIDLFAGGGVDPKQIYQIIQARFGDSFVLINKTQNGFNSIIKEIKVDVFDWKVPFTENNLLMDGIRLADPRDIFAYKCEAIMDRKSEKDFVDISLLMSHFPVESLIQSFKKRYPFISTGAVFPYLIKSELIVRDPSISYLDGFSFEAFASNIREKLAAYETSLVDKKRLTEEERIRKIQQLIEQKRKKQ